MGPRLCQGLRFVSLESHLASRIVGFVEYRPCFPQVWKELWKTHVPPGESLSRSRLSLRAHDHGYSRYQGWHEWGGWRSDVDKYVEAHQRTGVNSLKRFFDPGGAGNVRVAGATADVFETETETAPSFLPVARSTRDPGPPPARVAVYDDLTSTPRMEELRAVSTRGFIEDLTVRVYDLAREQGGTIPYTVIREIVENLIHARFEEVVVSVLDRGTTIRFSDHGPGIENKERSLEPGFSTATQEMKAVIRGVGSGLPIVKESLSFSGGYVTIEDNLGAGTVVTLRLEAPIESDVAPVVEKGSLAEIPLLTMRHKQVLSLAMELGGLGPTVVARELGVAVSTAYRDLASLEERGLLAAGVGGKRSLTDEGVSCLDSLFAS